MAPVGPVLLRELVVELTVAGVADARCEFVPGAGIALVRLGGMFGSCTPSVFRGGD